MATVYIAPTGNDTTGTGLIGAPWATLSKALNTAAVGDTIEMRGGTYANTFKNGRDTVTIQNYAGEQVIIQRTTTGAVLSFENSRNITIRKNPAGGTFTVRSTIAGSGNSTGIQQYLVTGGSPGFVSTNLTIDGVTVRDIAGWGIQIKDTTNVIVQNCDVSLCGTGIRYLRVTGTSFIQDNTIHNMNRLIANTVTPTNDDNGATGVAIDDGCQYVVVRRNLIYECHATSYDYVVDGGAVELYSCGGTGALGTTAGGNIIEDNTCYNNEGFVETGTGNATTYPMRGNIVRRNLVYGRCSFDATNNDTPAMYIRGGTDYYIYNNTFDIDDGGGIIYLQGAAGGYAAPVTNTKIKNNIIVSRSATVKPYRIYNVSTTGVEINYNLVYNSTGGTAKVADNGVASYAGTDVAGWRAATPYGDNDIWNTDPLWTNRSIRDYSLTAASPARNAGAVLGGTTTGYAESSPDIGAYEYSVATLAYIQDDFTRTVASGFGTATIGGAWTTDGTAANAAVNGSEATMAHSAAGVNLGGVSTALNRDVSVNLRWRVDVVPVGGAAVFQTYLRKIDTSNWLRFVVKLNTGTTGVTASFEKSIAGTVTTISAASTVTGLSVVADTWYYVRAETTGSTTATAKGRVWLDGTAEPTTWIKDETYTDVALMADGAFEFRSSMATGATSLPAVISVDSIAAIDLTPSDVTAPAAPIITTPAGSVYNTLGNVVLAGTAEADASVQIFDGATSKGATTATGGNWTLTIAGVSNGVHVYTAKATDTAGNTSAASASRTVTVDTVAPTVTVTSPLGGATGVVVSANVTATFSEAMDPLSLTTAAFTVTSAAGAAVAGAVTYASQVATFSPTAGLTANTTYTAALDATVNDVAGVALVPKSWSFTTATDAAAPVAPVITVPAADIYATSTSVTVSGTAASGSTVTLYDGTASIGTTTATGGAWTFALTAQAEGPHTYSATATVSGAESAASAVRTVTVDTISPTLAGRTPAVGAANVTIGEDVLVTFSEAMDEATITTSGGRAFQNNVFQVNAFQVNISQTSAFTVTGPGGTPVAGTIIYDAITHVARFHPSAPLAYGTTYTVTLSTAIRDLAGRAIP